ncbi:hypothetical protein FOCG_18514 [Fusarium oxysporum f. sp. radicis-lycopersici 26381]|nr:hypothetical protein FOCG_18514 [Fusarium oxysporum f. sp. radicis-lycopersici 26381]
MSTLANSSRHGQLSVGEMRLLGPVLFQLPPFRSLSLVAKIIPVSSRLF